MPFGSRGIVKYVKSLQIDRQMDSGDQTMGDKNSLFEISSDEHKIVSYKIIHLLICVRKKLKNSSGCRWNVDKRLCCYSHYNAIHCKNTVKIVQQN